MLYYWKDQIHLIEEGYKKLASSTSNILADSVRSKFCHISNKIHTKSAIQIIDTPFTALTSTSKAFINNLSYAILTPR